MRPFLPSRTMLAAIAMIVLKTCLFAQPPSFAPAKDSGKEATPTISVDSRLVNIPVVVRNDKGALVLTLKKEDFSLLVDGKPQVIRYFDLDQNLPLTLGLLVDTSGSVRNEIDDERTAGETFLDDMLESKDDKAFVIQFSRTVELLQDVTNSRPKLQAALQKLDTTAPDSGSSGGNSGSGTSDTNDSGGSSGGGRTRGFGGGTMLYDAVFLASDELMSKQKGRKALVVLTDGEDRGSKERLTDAIEKAQRSDTIVYAIYFKGQEPQQQRGGGGRHGGIGFPGGGGYPGGGGGYPGGGRRGGGGGGQPEQREDGKKILERMTSETGGRMFEVSKKETVANIFTEIGRELRSQYRLGYTPDADTAAEGYHKIDLAFTSKDKSKYTIQTRDGYYTGK
jgi:VWFA-related protein